MAVQRNKKDKLTIKVITSLDPGGVANLENRTVSNLNAALTDDEVFLLGSALSELLANETDSYRRTLEYDLAAE